MRAGSLCSGAGLLELAVAQVLDVETVWHAENDRHAALVLAHRWPGVPNLGDLTAVDWTAVEPVDVITAGFPCQPLSQAGRRKVTNDARWLWPHIAHAVRVLRPRLVVLENVPPLLRPWRDDDGWWNPAPVEEVAGDLAEAGYDTSWTCLRASDIGAPHRRERVFIVATADAGGERREGTEAPGRPRATAVRSAPSGTRRAARERHSPAADADSQRLPRRTQPHVGQDRSGFGPPRRAHTDGLGADAGLDEITRVAIEWGEYEPAIRRWERTLGRTPPAPVDGQGRLRPAFAEWMMGAPAGWITAVPGVPRTAQLRLVGNGVVVQQVIVGIAEALDALALERAA